jgi:hypothetical protein
LIQERIEQNARHSEIQTALKSIMHITCQFCTIPAIRCYIEHGDQSGVWLMKDFSRGNERSFGGGAAEMLLLASFDIGSTQS